MRRSWAFVVAALLVLAVSAQAAAQASAKAVANAGLDLESCREKARLHDPTAREAEYIDEGAAADTAVARRGYIPHLAISGKASYQSDSISLSLPIPGHPISIEQDKDQYNAVAEFSQLLWDGGSIAAQLRGIAAAAGVDRERLQADVYSLNDRVDQLFFGVLSAREQIKQNDVLMDELESSTKRVQASFENGVASRSDLDSMRVEMLDARQRSVELEAAERSCREMLGIYIGEPIPRDVEFSMPDVSGMGAGVGENRHPELGLFDAQAAQCDAQKDAIFAAKLPKVSAFFQAAYGKPGLNMLDSDAEPYWIGGLLLSWDPSALLDTKDELAKVEERRQSVAAQREAFLQGSDAQAAKLRSDIARLGELLSSDDELIALRAGLTASMQGKLDNGAATTDDLLKAIDAEALARRAKALHGVLLAQTVYDLKTLLND